MAKLPKVIKVGPMKIAVLRDPKVRQKNCWGTFVADRHEIRIAPKLPPDLLAETLFHELLHAVIHVAGAEVLDGDEEGLVGGLSPLLYDTLLRNPTLRRFLFSE